MPLAYCLLLAWGKWLISTQSDVSVSKMRVHCGISGNLQKYLDRCLDFLFRVGEPLYVSNQTTVFIFREYLAIGGKDRRSALDALLDFCLTDFRQGFRSRAKQSKNAADCH